MPICDFICEVCGKEEERLIRMGDPPLTCCGVVMKRLYTTGSMAIRDSRSLTGRRNERFIDRMDEIHKRQADKGERLRFVHPSEVVK